MSDLVFTHIELHKCRRLALGGFTTIKINPTSKIQKVLGTNGSGKSSLLRLGVSAIPPSRKFFDDGGYHLVHIRSGDKEYILRTSYNNNKTTCSFRVDGEELNKSHNETTQHDLVYTHFRVNKAIHDVLTLREDFARMSPAKRKEWIAILSPNDLDYGIAVHRDLKKSLNATNNIINHLTKRLHTETSKLPSRGKVDEVKALHESKTKDAEVLVATIGKLVCRSLPAIHHDIRTTVDAVERLTRYEKSPVVPDDITSYTSLTDKITQAQQHGMYLNGQLQVINTQYSESDSRLRELNLLTSETHEEMMVQLSLVSNVCSTVKKEFPEELLSNGVSYNRTDIVTLNKFLELYQTIQSSEHTLYGDDKNVSVLIEESDSLEKLLGNANKKIWTIEGRLEHIANCAEVECPRCETTFKPGVGESEKENLLQSLTKGKQFVEEKSHVLEKNKLATMAARQYQQRMREITSYMHSSQNVHYVWSAIESAGGLTQYDSVVRIVGNFIKQIPRLITYQENLKLKTRIEDNLQKKDSVMREKLQLDKQYVELKTTRDGIINEIETTRTTLKHLLSLQTHHNALEDKVVGIMQGYKRLGELRSELTDAILKEQLNTELKHLYSGISILEQELVSYDIQQGIVNDIRNDLERSQADAPALKLLVDSLSPSDGLLAEQMSSTIETIVAYMNSIINRIWGYNLIIRPPSIQDNGSLEYKFPMYAISEDNEVDDVSEGSDSQLSIVKQAFALAVYKFLGLEGYPLYIDELGGNFDEQHHSNLIPVLKEMAEDPAYSQLFIISHFKEWHGGLVNAQTIVLDDSHVSIDGVYNTHVVFE